jgi:hypothetical protein
MVVFGINDKGAYYFVCGKHYEKKETQQRKQKRRKQF